MKKLLLSSVCCMFLFIGCGGGGSSSSNNTTGSSTTGTVADGYISGATVCIDKNRNYSCDEGEKTYTTDNNGNYNFDKSEISYPHIASGGKNMATNEENNETLIKPAGETNAMITPLTTLVAFYMKANNATLSESKQVISNILGITESDITADPVKNPKIEKNVQKVMALSQLTGKNLSTIAGEIDENTTSITDLADNNNTIINVLNYIDDLNESYFTNTDDLEQNISNQINQAQTAANNINDFNEQLITTSETKYSDFNVSLNPGSYHIVFENNNVNQVAQIDINTSDILVNNEDVNNSDDANISSVNNNNVFDDIVLNVKNESNISIPFKTVDNSGVISTNVWAAVVDANYTNNYNHSIEINQTVINKFLLPYEVNQYYNFSTAEEGNYDVNISGILPNKLINYTVTLTDNTGKAIIDDEKVDNGILNRSVSLDANTTYTITISITDGKLDIVRNDYIGYYQLKITK